MDKFLIKNGYKVVKNIIPRYLLENLINTLAHRFSDLTKIELKNKPFNKSKISSELSEHLKKLRNEDPKIFGFLYDSVQSSVSLSQLLNYEKLVNKLSEITSVSKEFFSASGNIMRVDIPGTQKKNLYSWHQETSYYKQNSDGKNCYFIWIPFFNVKKNNGAITIAEKSHDFGYQKTKVFKKSSIHSEQRIIDPKIIKNCKIKQPKISSGDACICHFNLIHKSGKNISKDIKLTAIGRYHFAKTPMFKPFRYSFKYNRLLVKSKN